MTHKKAPRRRFLQFAAAAAAGTLVLSELA